MRTNNHYLQWNNTFFKGDPRARSGSVGNQKVGSTFNFRRSQSETNLNSFVERASSDFFSEKTSSELCTMIIEMLNKAHDVIEHTNGVLSKTEQERNQDQKRSAFLEGRLSQLYEVYSIICTVEKKIVALRKKNVDPSSEENHDLSAIMIQQVVDVMKQREQFKLMQKELETFLNRASFNSDEVFLEKIFLEEFNANLKALHIKNEALYTELNTLLTRSFNKEIFAKLFIQRYANFFHKSYHLVDKFIAHYGDEYSLVRTLEEKINKLNADHQNTLKQNDQQEEINHLNKAIDLFQLFKAARLEDVKKPEKQPHDHKKNNEDERLYAALDRLEGDYSIVNFLANAEKKGGSRTPPGLSSENSSPSTPRVSRY